MKQILPRVWQWSWFSEEKHIDFNGYFLEVGEHRILVDPPPLTSIEMAQLRQGEQLDYIVLTNRDHEREANTYKKEFNCQVFVPEKDAEEMSVTADKTFSDGELLPGGMWVVQLSDQQVARRKRIVSPTRKGHSFGWGCTHWKTFRVTQSFAS